MIMMREGGRQNSGTTYSGADREAHFDERRFWIAHKIAPSWRKKEA
jgi:hypothetical protein